MRRCATLGAWVNAMVLGSGYIRFCAFAALCLLKFYSPRLCVLLDQLFTVAFLQISEWYFQAIGH